MCVPSLADISEARYSLVVVFAAIYHERRRVTYTPGVGLVLTT